MAVVWLPPDYGDAIACVCADGTLSLWEEIAEGQLFLFYLIICFYNSSSPVYIVYSLSYFATLHSQLVPSCYYNVVFVVVDLGCILQHVLFRRMVSIRLHDN